VAFVPLAGRPPVALAILALAAVSDVLDGWLARRSRWYAASSEGARSAGWAVRPEVPEGGARRLPTRLAWVGWGEWLDPVCDKFFIIAVMAGLYLAQHPALLTLLPIVTREIAILILFLIHRLVPSLRRIRYDYKAHFLGKAATAAQFLASAALLVAHPSARYLTALCALLGLLCAGVYARRGRTIARRLRANG